MKSHHEWPRSKTAVRLIRTGPTDDLGRCSFELLWWDRYGRARAQCFFAKPHDTRKRLLATIRERQ
jgi:hypothetical protein